jgi:hypothetical protein
VGEFKERPESLEEWLQLGRRAARLSLVLAGVVFVGMLAISRFKVISIWISHMEIHANVQWLGLQWDSTWDRPGVHLQEIGHDGPHNPNRSEMWDAPPFPGPATVGRVTWWVAVPVAFAIIFFGIYFLRPRRPSIPASKDPEASSE